MKRSIAQFDQPVGSSGTVTGLTGWKAQWLLASSVEPCPQVVEAANRISAVAASIFTNHASSEGNIPAKS
jgi:hypothetical protein